MIRHQLDVHVTNKTGGTALHLAAYSGHVSCVELLLQYGACVNTADTLNCTPLFGACERGHVEVVNILIRRKEDSCKFWHCVIRITLPIHFWSQKSGICYLRGFCGDVTSHENQEKLCSGEGLTLGTSAEIHQLPTALSVPLSTSIDIIQCFLCFCCCPIDGAIVDFEDQNGRSPLHWAARGGHSLICQILIKSGVPPDKKDCLR